MSTTTHPDTGVIADEALPTIRLTREFDAPAARVFRAHTDPKLYAQWVGPHQLTTTIGDWDCRTGGAWSFKQADPEGNQYDFYGSFHEIRADEVIVQTFTFAGYPDGVSLERITFEDLGEGRSRVTTLSVVDTFEARDAMISSGMESGIREGYAKLDDLLSAGHETKGTQR